MTNPCDSNTGRFNPNLSITNLPSGIMFACNLNQNNQRTDAFTEIDDVVGVLTATNGASSASYFYHQVMVQTSLPLNLQ